MARLASFVMRRARFVLVAALALVVVAASQAPSVFDTLEPAGFVTIFAALAALLVIPALLHVLGDRVDALAVGPRRDPTRPPRVWGRVLAAVGRRPAGLAGLALVALLALSVPAWRRPSRWRSTPRSCASCSSRRCSCCSGSARGGHRRRCGGCTTGSA